MQHLLILGTAKAIGVSNFSQKHLEELLEDSEVPPALNQLEIHPYCQQRQLLEFCRERGIVVQAHSPFASGAYGLLKDPVLTAIAQRVNKSVGQVILRWHVQEGRAVIPKSSSASRIAENLSLFDFELSEDDLAAIRALEPTECPRRVCPDPTSLV